MSSLNCYCSCTLYAGNIAILQLLYVFKNHGTHAGWFEVSQCLNWNFSDKSQMQQSKSRFCWAWLRLKLSTKIGLHTTTQGCKKIGTSGNQGAVERCSRNRGDKDCWKPQVRNSSGPDIWPGPMDPPEGGIQGGRPDQEAWSQVCHGHDEQGV